MNNNILKWFFLVFLVMPNIIFFGYWIHHMVIEFLIIIFNKSQKLFKIVTFCCCCKPEEFKRKYIDKLPKLKEVKVKAISDTNNNYSDGDASPESPNKYKTQENFLGVDDINLEFDMAKKTKKVSSDEDDSLNLVNNFMTQRDKQDTNENPSDEGEEGPSGYKVPNPDLDLPES